MSDVDTSVVVEEETPFIHREGMHGRVSNAEHKRILRDAVIPKLAADGVDTSLIVDLPVEDVRYQIIDGAVYVYFQEPWPEGYSPAEALAAVAERTAAAAGTTT
jgi:hypothetical protein